MGGLAVPPALRAPAALPPALRRVLEQADDWRLDLCAAAECGDGVCERWRPVGRDALETLPDALLLSNGWRSDGPLHAAGLGLAQTAGRVRIERATWQPERMVARLLVRHGTQWSAVTWQPVASDDVAPVAADVAAAPALGGERVDARLLPLDEPYCACASAAECAAAAATASVAHVPLAAPLVALLRATSLSDDEDEWAGDDSASATTSDGAESVPDTATPSADGNKSVTRSDSAAPPEFAQAGASAPDADSMLTPLALSFDASSATGSERSVASTRPIAQSVPSLSSLALYGDALLDESATVSSGAFGRPHVSPMRAPLRPGTPDPFHKSPRERSLSGAIATSRLGAVSASPTAVNGHDDVQWQSSNDEAEPRTPESRARVHSPRSGSSLASGASSGARSVAGQNGSAKGKQALSPFIGSFEASLLAGRMSHATGGSFPGFSAKLVVTGRDFLAKPLSLPFDAQYCVVDDEHISLPYVGDIALPRGGYKVPAKGLVQLTLANPSGTPLKTFLVPYDVSDMPPLTKTFLRQRIVVQSGERSVLKYAVHLKFCSPRRRRWFLYKYVRVVFPFRAPDENQQLATLVDQPANPRYFPTKQASPAQREPDEQTHR